MSDYYNPGSVPANGAFGSSNTIRSEFAAVSSGISDKLPPLTGAANKVVVINSTATGQTTQATNGTGNLVRATGAAIDLASATNLPAAQLTGLAAGVAAFLASSTSANLRTAVTDETGSGSLVFGTSPTLVSPALGTPTSGTLTNTTGFPASQLAGLAAGIASFLATPTSANLAAALTDETGTGAAVFANSPTLISPNLGTPSAINLTNASAFPATSITGVLPIANGGTASTTAIQAANNLGFSLGGTRSYNLAGGLIFHFGNFAATTDAASRATYTVYNFGAAANFGATLLAVLIVNTNPSASLAHPIADFTVSGPPFGNGTCSAVWSTGTTGVGAGVATNASVLIISA